MARNIGPTNGPFLAAAVFCEMILNEDGGIASLIRIHDRITQVAQGPGAPAEMPPIQPPNLWAFISFKSGAARGGHKVRFEREDPSGLMRSDAPELDVLFEGDDRGVNIVVRVTDAFSEQGLYWYRVLLDGELITKMPLRVVYQRLTTGGR